MFQLSLIFSHFLMKLFALRQLTQTLMRGLILLLMGFWGGKFEHSFFDARVFNPGVYMCVCVCVHVYIVVLLHTYIHKIPKQVPT